MADIKDKDQKILCGRSAGMCSLCRVKLTFDDAAGDPNKQASTFDKTKKSGG